MERSKLLACLRLATFSLAALVLTQAQAFDDDPSSSDSSYDQNYEAIVDQLSKETSALDATTRAKQKQAYGQDPFDLVMMHGGIGFSGFFQRIRLADGSSYTINQQGMQASLGIDLFSPNWMAEGTARSFGEDGNSHVRSSVQEFELKVYYKDKLSKHLGYRAGLGLTGRYLTLKEQGFANREYTTPTSVASLGSDFFITDRVSLGADMNARSSLIGDTIDKNSFDLTLRLDTHF